MNTKPWLASAALGMALGLAACGGGDNGDTNDTAPMSGALRAVNGITDSSGLTVTVARSTPPPPVPPPNTSDPNAPPPPTPPPPTLTPVTIDASNIAFGSASVVNVLPSVYYHLKVAPAAGTATDTDYVPIYDGNLSTVFTYGTTASSGSFIVRQVTGLPVPAGQFTVQFVHAASAVSQTDYTLCLQLTPVDSSGAIPTPPLILSSFATASGPFSLIPSFNVTASTYLLRVLSCTDNFDGTYALGSILFDSGSAGLTLPPTGTRMLQVGALDASASQNSQYGSPLTLLLLDDASGSKPLFAGQN